MTFVRTLAPLLAAFFISSCLLASAADGDESPRALVEAAIKAHGGADNLKKTRCVNLQAKGTLAMIPGTDRPVLWEENFELPGRYRRRIDSEGDGKPIQAELAVTEGKGWFRANDKIRDFDGDKTLASKSWAAVLGNLPDCLAAGVTLKSAGTEMVDGKPAKKVIASGAAVLGNAVLFLDEKTHRLVKLTRRAPNTITTTPEDVAILLGDFKEVAGVVFPHHLVVLTNGGKTADLEITRIDFPRTLDDRLFVKPK
ncbi:MAG TPA: hypothetical protein VHR72_08945 [Gemmataceae bacterium]|jgi:hypothetical protein|nr:hypothetical protein [Gemmataceae bacterium]